MIVKNEDHFVYFAIKSVLPYVDQFLITDTGSTDHTLNILRGIKSDKIVFRETLAKTASEVTAARQAQLEATHDGWIWLIDGDEVYPKSAAEEVVSAIKSGKYEGVVVGRYDLLGDIYHHQSELVGAYHLFGRKGHLVIRALNKDRLPQLHLAGNYPLEGYYDQNNIEVIYHNPTNYYFTRGRLYHAMYLKRSSNDQNVFNRGKYKYEKGYAINEPPPEVFFSQTPTFIPSPLHKRSFFYELIAFLITPLKKLKRRYFDNSNYGSKV